ncbi:RimK domain protein ATP-grasp [Methanococcus vannielii SB]|uniref:RimK domain protein ATP-grasp n=1 Tax=Methanococcus vannielii (strain ATCC 35089 / DSM 1224 / JCM 13029 / OCM 148 / SB) TaxID=406327 RepID=A6US45_METVS|nr:RimK family alpha-L-glutamate ligase [Methanococcus vannielii]ABR55317.1 RimK domain protein ATP-grasp [Methanococcus vannielii SB]
MGKLGVFVDRQTLSSSNQLRSLIRFRDIAESMGHEFYFLFPNEINKIKTLDGLFIRCKTDPMNISYVASRMAELHGVKVIDDSKSIRICADKINMYSHMIKNGINIPKTIFMKKSEVNEGNAEKIISELGLPLVLKEPSTSFSVRVEKITSLEEFMKVANRFTRLSDIFVVQEFIGSKFDWRIGVINGEIIYTCKYHLPKESFKIQDCIDGHMVFCTVESIPLDEVPKKVLELGLKAANAVGNGLYGIDLKERNGEVYVIEVNDNPSMETTEDEFYPEAYLKIISYIMNTDKSNFHKNELNISEALETNGVVNDRN